MTIDIPDSCECMKPYDGDICARCIWDTACTLVELQRDFAEHVERQKKLNG